MPVRPLSSPMPQRRLTPASPYATSLKEQDNIANAKSIISVLTLALVQGSEVELTAEGPDEQQAVDSLIELIDGGFGEV